MVLLLRQRGPLTADQLAAELEVSTRTVQRDIGALSSAGVPVYAERGRHGGYALLPGFRTELTGLNRDEALALLTSGADRGQRVFGLSTPWASAMRKVIDALPEVQRTSLDAAAQRFLVEPETDLLSRRATTEDLGDGVLAEVRHAVLTGRRLRFDYAAEGATPGSRTVDPLGLVTVRGRTYLLALRSGDDRTYRLARMSRAQTLTEPAQRPESVDLDRLWAERCAEFLSTDHLPVIIRVRTTRRDEVLDTARGVRAEEPDAEGWVRLEVTFEDLRHAVWAVWRLGTDAEVMAPPAVREALRERALVLAARYDARP